MVSKLIGLLESFGYPVFRQGSLTEDEPYPETFFTFWNNIESENQAFDNITTEVLYDYDVNVYSTDPDRVYSLLKEARTLLRKNGFRTPDRGHDIGSDEPTHTGRGMNVTILNNEN